MMPGDSEWALALGGGCNIGKYLDTVGSTLDRKSRVLCFLALILPLTEYVNFFELSFFHKENEGVRLICKAPSVFCADCSDSYV